ncbi:MAG: hypothetical protein H6815_02245 [Phycisphaeraceae bacterium]|nr:hypothetical protein [Phycisphaerales bacterium]MCB9859248.1 hypothetical protein [Phycisphaeraceae bacterium]
MSSFSFGTDGWQPNTGAVVNWESSGGVSDGYLRIVDNGNTEDMAVIAPSTYHGDLTQYNDGVMSFYFREGDYQNNPGPLPFFGTVTITSTAGTVAHVFITDLPTTTWERHAAPLTAEVWGVNAREWDAILRNVTDIRVRVEAVIGDEWSGFDSFTIRGCYADCDLDDDLDIFDYICFGNEYAALGSYADCDGDGDFDIFDYICYGNAFAMGCQ